MRNTHPHERSRGDELPRRLGERAPCRPGREHDERPDERLAPADPVPEDADRQHAGREREHERGAEPLQLRLRRMQAIGERRERDGEDREIEAHHQHSHREHRESDPAETSGHGYLL